MTSSVGSRYRVDLAQRANLSISYSGGAHRIDEEKLLPTP
jgi:hypothetical protein